MSDHRFEKQVGQKLDDLKLTPSAKSWENIERELRKDKRRPAPVFWLPLVLLGLSAIGYFVFTGHGHNDVLSKNDSQAPQRSQAPHEALPAPAGKEDLASRSKDPILKETAVAEKGQANRSVKSTSRFNTTSSDQVSYHTPTSPISPAPRRGLPNFDGTEGQLAATEKQGHTEEILVVEPTENNPSKSSLPVQSGTNLSTEGVKDIAKTLPEEKAGKMQEYTTEGIAEQNPNPKPNKKKTKKWSFGINAFGGLSSLSEGKLSFSNSQIASVTQNRQPVLSFASPAVVPPPTTSPSKIYPGISFSAGLITKYNLSKRFSLSAGVNYLQINTISKVGYKFEQSNYTILNADRAEAMYLPPASEQVRNYDNKYHFIEIPFNLHTRINKSEKLPLYWNAGFLVSKLIKSNSLHYDAVEHYYYSDDDLLKKMQTAVSTGFSIAVFNKTQRPLWIGPTVRYNLSQALKKEISPSNKHFMGIGLDVKWFIK